MLDTVGNGNRVRNPDLLLVVIVKLEVHLRRDAQPRCS